MKLRWKLVIVGGVLAIVWVVIAPRLASSLIVKKPLAYADAIIVLSGSAVYKERTRKAAELYRQGIAPMIFITNDGEKAGWSKELRSNPSFVDLERRELLANGVLPDAIKILPGVVSGTDQEAALAAAEISYTPISSLLIVTSAYHTSRSLSIFEKTLAGHLVEIGVEHAPLAEDDPTPSLWWLSRKGWRTIGGEYVKSTYYWFAY